MNTCLHFLPVSFGVLVYTGLVILSDNGGSIILSPSTDFLYARYTLLKLLRPLGQYPLLLLLSSLIQYLVGAGLLGQYQ